MDLIEALKQYRVAADAYRTRSPYSGEGVAAELALYRARYELAQVSSVLGAPFLTALANYELGGGDGKSDRAFACDKAFLTLLEQLQEQHPEKWSLAHTSSPPAVQANKEDPGLTPSSDQAGDLARCAIACPRWQWKTGMTCARLEPDDGQRIVVIGRRMAGVLDPCWSQFPCIAKGDPHRFGVRWIALNRVEVLNRWLPDFADGPTVGGLLTLVREAWNDNRLVAIYCEAANPGQSEGWAVQRADNRLPIAGGDYASEVAALLAALEAAPEHQTREAP